MKQRLMKCFRWSVACVALALATCAVPGAAWAETKLTFGIVPQQSASRLAKMWVPFFAYLSAKTNVQIRFATAKDIPTFEACLAKGAYDFAYMNPYHYTTFHELVGYEAFAKQSEKRLRGLIVVRADSSYKQLKDLNNMPIAFPSPAAFGASVIPRAEIKNREMTIEPSYVKSHDSVYRGVIAGLFPAGGGVLRTFNNISEAERAKLRVLYQTDAYTPHAFAALPSVESKLVKTLVDAMTKIEPQHASLLKGIGMGGIQKAVNADWDDVRALKLRKSETEIILDDQIECHSD